MPMSSIQPIVAQFTVALTLETICVACPHCCGAPLSFFGASDRLPSPVVAPSCPTPLGGCMSRPNCARCCCCCVACASTCDASSEFDTGTETAAPAPTPSARPMAVTASSSMANCAATFAFFTPIAVSTPISYLRSRMLKMVSTTSTTAPTHSTTMSSVFANVARLFNGTRLASYCSTSADETVYSLPRPFALASASVFEMITSPSSSVP